MTKPKKYYAVARGFQPGIYTAWFGEGGAEKQVKGFTGALYRGFASLVEARQWLAEPSSPKAQSPQAKTAPNAAEPVPSPGTAIVYTDGSSRGNPGPGGYGVIIVEKGSRVELAEGFRLTTNNRMELMACIAALRSVTSPAVILHSDSRYVVNGIDKGWAQKWRANGWMRTKSDAAENSDLWEALLTLCDRRRVTFRWVRGHAGHRENERCDELAAAAAQGERLREDRAYVRGHTKIPDCRPQDVQ